MSDQQSNGQQPNGQPAEHSSTKRIQALVAGGVFIVLGLVFIVRNITGFSMDNWWALFILIPAAGSLGTAYRMYQRDGGRFTAASRGPLAGGLILLTVTAVFLFKLDWGAVWPVFPILIGVGLILNSFGK